MCRKIHKGWALYALGSALISDAVYQQAGKPSAIVWAACRVDMSETEENDRAKYWF